MTKPFRFASLLALLGAAPAVQAGPPSVEPAPFVVRISVDLVQVDAVVTDKQGHLVTDLRPEDFEIVEDGRKQTLTNVAYVSLVVPAPAGSGPTGVGAAEARPEARRRIALVVDDLRHGFVSTVHVRDAIRRFIAERLEPGDQASLVFSSSGLSGGTPYTSDRARLLVMVDSLIWGRGWLGSEVSALDPVSRSLDPFMQRQPNSFWGGRRPQGGFAEDVYRKDHLGRLAYESSARAFVAGTFGTVNDVIDDLRGRPGRKSLVLFSDGVPVIAGSDEYPNVVDALRRLVDQANRASVVLYTMDARGVQAGGLTAQDSLRLGEDPANLIRLGRERRIELDDSQDPLRYLAAETGGLFLGTNDLGDSLGRMLADQAGFYLLGYVPSSDTFKPRGDGPRFHKVRVRVKRPGVQVRSRKGFFGIADTESATAVPAPEPRVAARVASTESNP